MSETPEDLDAALVQAIWERMPKVGIRKGHATVLGERVGVSKQSMSKMLNGHNRISVARLNEIAAALDTDGPTLMTEALRLMDGTNALAGLSSAERAAVLGQTDLERLREETDNRGDDVSDTKAQ